jgi:hypothetical protein
VTQTRTFTEEDVQQAVLAEIQRRAATHKEIVKAVDYPDAAVIRALDALRLRNLVHKQGWKWFAGAEPDVNARIEAQRVRRARAQANAQNLAKPLQYQLVDLLEDKPGDDVRDALFTVIQYVRRRPA